MHTSKKSITNRLLILIASSLTYIITAESQEPPPEFILTQQERDALASPILNQLQNLQQQQGIKPMVYLESIALGALDQREPIESPEAVAGTSLSTLFFGDLRPFNRDRLLEGKNLVRTNEEFKTSITLYIAIEQLLRDESVPFIQWLATRSTKAPVTRCDKVILVCLPDEFSGFSGAFWNGSRTSWKAMLSAKNPVYRLIALRNAHLFETDSAILLADYQNGLSESNTLLQNAAFEGLKRIGTPAARASLQSFLNLNRPANDGTMPEDFDINAVIQQYLNPQ